MEWKKLKAFIEKCKKQGIYILGQLKQAKEVKTK